MKRILIGAGLVAMGLVFSGSAIAADGAALYKAKCLACHGADGKGTAMAPAFAGSEYMKTASDDDVTNVIVKGRQGADKKYKNFAIGMPPQKLADDETKAIVDYIKSLAK